ncbi:hypothetical protein LPTSP3_g20960 [Leptospira kobayashii]|uniref:Uncharacterized protein n=1 Tax=Leptospira kobayashii TaxID=1917830 RepID=A0ABN6KGZ4_9LEPT|nr:hypothetical protein [Leptospira kobayashii]BDA79166.1 hypothetical protein LPTSP3_g20960 [Leptospira kobayashii]
MSYLFLFSIVSFLLLIIIHWILCRLTGSERFVLKSLSVNFLFIVFSFYFFFLHFGILDSLFIYLGLVILWNSYLVFFINLQNSISFRILLTIFDSKEKSLSYAEITKFYSDEESLRDRLSSMEINQFISLNKDSIKILPKGITFANVFLFFRNLFGIRKFG